MPSSLAHRPEIVLVLLGLAAAAATMVGGTLALRLERRIHLILGFSAGAVMGVALLDLLPEALELSRKPSSVLVLTAIGFMAYLAADRALARPAAGEHLGAGSLTLHSVMDGLAIGLSFQVSPAAAAVVTLAVLAHDVSDGGEHGERQPGRVGGEDLGAAVVEWPDAAAPLVGIFLSRLVTVSQGHAGPGPGRLRRLLPVHRGQRTHPGQLSAPPEGLDHPGHAHRLRGHLGCSAAGCPGCVALRCDLGADLG